jgi:hypothetical protein
MVKYVSFVNAKTHSWNFSLKKTIWYVVLMFGLLERLSETNTIQLSGVCLLTLHSLA